MQIQVYPTKLNPSHRYLSQLQLQFVLLRLCAARDGLTRLTWADQTVPNPHCGYRSPTVGLFWLLGSRGCKLSSGHICICIFLSRVLKERARFSTTISSSEIFNTFLLLERKLPDVGRFEIGECRTDISPSISDRIAWENRSEEEPARSLLIVESGESCAELMLFFFSARRVEAFYRQKMRKNFALWICSGGVFF